MNLMDCDEYLALLASYGKVQAHCTRLISEQHSEIERLHAELMLARAAIIVRDSALAMAREDLAELKSAAPDLPKRLEMARRIASQQARIEQLQRECTALRQRSAPQRADRGHELVDPHLVVETIDGHILNPDEEGADDGAALEANLGAADLVICRTGCIGHGAYWRVQDYCKRTGKQCVLLEDANSVQVVRVHRRVPDGEAAQAEAKDAGASIAAST